MTKSNFKEISKSILREPIEIVYFAFPTCNGNCAHCWSNKLQLGTVISLKQHQKNIDKIAILKCNELKLSGGEPFFNRNLGFIIDYARKKMKNSKITIFTSGRPFVSKKSGNAGIEETYKNLCSLVKDFTGISIHMSADEYHANAIKRLSNSNLSKEKLLEKHVKNFIGACEKIKDKYHDFDYKLKIHVDFGRLEYHRKNLYSWMNDEFWNDKIIKSEGLIKSGNAENFENSITLKPSNQWSLFVLPGVDLVEDSEKFIDTFTTKDSTLKLIQKHDEGIVIAGWWNLIDKKAYYFRLSDIN